jgi:hypothetical protein
VVKGLAWRRGPRSDDSQTIKVNDLGNVIMGYVRMRVRQDGSPRYTAYFWDVRGRERSAGTFASKKDAVRA